MPATLDQLPPEGLLTAAVDALLAEDPAGLDPRVAGWRTKVLLAQAERLAAAALAAIADLDDRELFALDGAGSTRGWLRQQPAGDQGQLSLARRLRTRTVVRSALEAGTVDTRAATAVCTALVAVDELEAGTGLGGGIEESQVIGVLVHAVPDLLRPWVGFCPLTGELSGGLPDEDADLRNQALGRQELLAQAITVAAEALGAPVSQRLEPVFTLLARGLSPHALTDALSTILHALEPERLEAEDEAFQAELGYTLVKRPTRGWDFRAVLDDEIGTLLDAGLRARLKQLSQQPAAESGEPGEHDNPTPEPVADDDWLAQLTDLMTRDNDSTSDTDPAEDAGAPGADRSEADDEAAESTPTTEPHPSDAPCPTADAESSDDLDLTAEPQPPDAPAPSGAPPGGQQPLFDPPPARSPEHGTAGPGVPLLPWDYRPEAPVEGPMSGGTRTTGYAALRMLLRDAFSAAPGSGTPTPAHLSITATAPFLAGTTGAPAPVLDTKRLSALTTAALRRLGCDSLLSALILDAAGTPIGASGQHRNATERERRALRAQWGNSCATNGCTNPQTIPHHVRLWAVVHRTRLRDLIPLCEPHHHDIHDGKRTLRLRDGRLVNENGWTTTTLTNAA